MQYKIISFYSEPEKTSTYYTEHSKRFVRECEQHGLDYHVEALDGEGNYFKNCRLKPGFVVSCMERFQQPLLWLDIDTYIKKRPSLPNSDFAAIQRPISASPPYPIFAHCLFFNNTETSTSLLRTWKTSCDAETGPHVGDHSLLCKVLEKENFKYEYIEDFTKYTLAPVTQVTSKKRKPLL